MFPRDVVGFFDRPRTRRLAPVWMAALSVWASGLGCAVPQSSEEPVGSIQIAITNVPGDVSCLQITVSDGLRPVVRKIDVTPMADLTTTQSGLPVGLVSIGVDAFNVTCPAVTAASLPTWVSGTVQATLVGSVPVMLSVNMSRPGSASIGIMFPGGGGGSGGGGSAGGGGAAGGGGIAGGGGAAGGGGSGGGALLAAEDLRAAVEQRAARALAAGAAAARASPTWW
jgi:hypothetical protein